MLTAMLTVNWLAVLVCGIVLMVVGFVWYTALGSQWAKYTGWTREKVAQQPRNQMIMSYVITFITALVIAWGLAGILKLANITTISRALALAAVAWAAFAAAPGVSNFAFERRPWGLFLVIYLDHLVGFLICSVILVLWK